ncbi:bacteriorhodopsin [Sphingobium sp. B7D2B]|uniref:hypothetical protein n=1 Tax=Sphingobium sp. B7D2B TaxID=2940583 RepID=UPI002223F02F|nr:hypothetical protein [Sphingobium sp. B7D2B]MCW2366512.1 bacteriorhodopsin [Sphingobium sp. B7D2B]
MRLARILALLVVLATVGVSAYFLYRMPFAWLQIVPAAIGVGLCLWFWRTAPKRKKARKRAALATVLFVPLLMASAVLSLTVSPESVWPVFTALALLAMMVAVLALMRIERKQNHVWAGYYSDVA